MSLYRSGLRVFERDTWQIPRFFISLYLFWMTVFAVNRLVFILYNLRAFTKTDFWDIAASFFHAIHLDTSAACYLLVLSYALIFFQAFFNLHFINWIQKIYIGLGLLAITLLVSAELGVFSEWGTKLHYGAISHLQHPEEIIETAENNVLIVGILLWLGQFSVCYFLYWKFFHINLHHKKRTWLVSVAFVILTPPLVFLGIRGGWQEIPINQSDAYFSKYDIVNLASVNSAWNLGHSIEQNRAYLANNPYDYFPLDEARATVDSIYYHEKDTTIVVLNNRRPNVVMLLLESWSADMIEALGGYKGIAPFFDSLCTDGLLFSKTYSSGDRSDQGMAAIFSGFPAQTTTSIIKQHNKFSQLPSINTQMKEAGYSSSFIFGGQLSYGNIKAYMMFNGFDKIIEGSDYNMNVARGKLGVHDEVVLARQLEELKNEKEPFFSAAFTLSSHSPYDMPMDWTIDWGGDHQGYLNSVRYTDNCLRDYFREAKKQPWYANTLFILVADHSHASPTDFYIFHPEYRQIPMLFFGEVLKDEYRNYRYDRLCSQVDLTATLMCQLDMDATRYKWSKNLFNPTYDEFAFYGFIDGLAWMRPDSFFVYHKGIERFLCDEDSSFTNSPKMLREGYSYLQVLFQEYLDY